jgi:hypothetical protein
MVWYKEMFLSLLFWDESVGVTKIWGLELHGICHLLSADMLGRKHKFVSWTNIEGVLEISWV